MALFSTNKINEESEVVADMLRQERQAKKISLKDASEKLGINLRYLKAIEEGDFGSLPKGLYGKNYMREYALFLGFDAKKTLESFKIEDYSGASKKNPFLRKLPKASYFLTIPRIIKNFIVIAVILVCLGYLGYYLNNIIIPPHIKILNPASDLTINENHVVIIGETEPETEITINDEAVLTNDEGRFEKDINLKTGLNVISIIGQKKYSRKNKIIRQIIVNE